MSAKKKKVKDGARRVASPKKSKVHPLKVRTPAAAQPAPDVAEVVGIFEGATGLHGLSAEVKERSDGAFLIIKVGNATDRFYAIVNNINETLPPDNRFAGRVTLKKEARHGWLVAPETRLFQQTLSERLTVGRNSVQEEFSSRYIASVLGAENQISVGVNHLVFGRRGAGKSTLLVYAAKMLESGKSPYAWVAMQTYEKRGDEKVTVEVLLEVLAQIDSPTTPRPDFAELGAKLKVLGAKAEVSANEVRELLPLVKRVLAPIAAVSGRLTLFLDDLHVLDPEFQPQFLSHMYAFARGNNIVLKISAIENLTRSWDPSTKTGLQSAHDVQSIRLDYNLTAPDKAKKHLIDILDVNAKFCGLPSVHALCGAGVLNRVVWASAGVPRDAIYTLLEGLTHAVQNGRKVIAVADINTALSSSMEEKLRALALDAGLEQEEMQATLDSINTFCREERKNAFLIEIRNNQKTYKTILKLIDLRFLHVLSPGITPDHAGRRYMALLLDFGFYVGIRAARAIELFQEELKAPSSKDLRGLPKFVA